jgi:6-phosphogluconolactonase
MDSTGPYSSPKKARKVKAKKIPDVSANADELAQKAATWLSGFVAEVLKKQDRFTIALSGGNTPKKLYSLLASEKYGKKIDWDKLHFFWGDERYLPFTDERNNARMAFDALLDHVPVRKEHIHIMRTDIEPEASAVAYEQTLRSYFDNTPFSFDLVLLGLGDNAHTLSLFPGYDSIHEREKWVISFYLNEQQMHRITLTAPIVNRARRLAFLVSGADKAAALFQVKYGRHDPDLYPAQLIQPYAESPYWFVDEAAAKEL